MTTETKNPKIELVTIKDEDCLRFIFSGHLSVEDAEYGVGEWKDFFDLAGDQKVIIIWDSRQMNGFDNKARVIWQQAIKDLKKQIDCVWLIANSKIIRAGAKVMSAFTSFSLKVVKDESEIKI